MNKVVILHRALRGELNKLIIKLRFRLNRMPAGLKQANDPNVIVSLTSYGRRVKKTLPYTLYSLVTQKLKPDKIIVWLDNVNWNDDNLPKDLKKFKELGVTFMYCEDIKSYKKLIPTLQLYPSSRIITTDDDLFYPKTFVRDLVKASDESPQFVHAYMVHEIRFNGKNQLEPYKKWKHFISINNGGVNFPTSGGGCIFTSQHLYKDVCNTKLCSNLSPTADDIWFFFMTYLAGIKVSVVKAASPTIPLDAFYQKFHKGSNLMSVNCGEDHNDLQIKNIMDYYSISPKNLQTHRLKPSLTDEDTVSNG